MLNKKYTSADTSTMNRIRNTLTAAIRDQILLPKMVFIVPDDNFLTIINSIYRSSILKRIEKILNWRMMEHSMFVSPKQGEMTNYPHFIWIEASYHDIFHNNEIIQKFNNCLETTGKLHDKLVLVLKVKKIWNPSDINLYIKESRRLLLDINPIGRR